MKNKNDMQKMKKNSQYNVFDTFCLRTPLFPFSFYRDIVKNSSVSEKDFLQLLNNVVLREAIYLASPELGLQLEKWQEGLIVDQKKIERLRYSLLKYAFRISTRCTPFGLFASCAGGEFGTETEMVFQKVKPHNRVTRFDMSFLSQLLEELLKDEKIRKKLLYYPNTTLYSVGNHLRYLEYELKNKKREYSLEGITSNKYIEEILNEARNGKTIEELVKCILREGISDEETLSFVEELIGNQVLVSELELTVTGGDYFDCLIEKVKKISNSENQLQWLQQLKEQLLTLDEVVGNSAASYKKIIELSKQRITDFNTKYFLQTDCFSNLKANTLKEGVKNQLIKSIPFFAKMQSSFSNAKMEKFKTEFRKRFDDAKVSLNTVLDSEIGIGYGGNAYDNSQFLNDVQVGRSFKEYQQINWTRFDDVMQEKLFNAYLNKDQTILLQDSDVEGFSKDWKSPDTFSAMIEDASFSEGKIFISNLGGTSASYLLGRFAGGDQKLYDHVQEVFDFEEKVNPDKIIAEIVHLPESRVGNILQRSNNRSFEIPYVGKSSLRESQQIEVDDILVSVRQNKVILESKRFEKEIIPKLSNAHNFRGNPLPAYEFLCDLQNEEKTASVGFYWNPVLLKCSYLPRVEYKNLILSKARWVVKVSDWEELVNTDNLLNAVETWRIEKNIPVLVDFVERDNKLLINLKNKDAVLMLYHTVKKKRSFILEEFLFKKDLEGIDNDDFYCNQYVISFYNNSKMHL